MNSFADQKKISSYSLALAEKMASNFFASKARVETPDIKVFSSVEQLNLFLIKNLFEKWQEETIKLKSPYFNYTSEEVQISLQKLLNILSNHISISKEFFKPLLEKAISDTLLFVLDPLLYIKKEFLSGDSISMDTINKTEKFFKINKTYIQVMKDAFINSGKETLSSEAIFQQLIEKGLQPEESKFIIAHFSSLLKIELNEMLIEPELKPSLHEVQIELTNTPHITAGEISNISAAESPNISYEPERESELMEPKTELPLNERFSREEKTLNEILAKNATEGIKGERIADLRSAIPLNERFLYIKELFNDNPSAFAVAVAELEKAPGLDAALELIKINYVEKFNWDINNPFCSQFIQLVERRFME